MFLWLSQMSAEELWCFVTIGLQKNPGWKRPQKFLILLETGAAVWSDQVAQCFVQAGHENLKGQRLHNLSWQHLPPPDSPYREKASIQVCLVLNYAHYLSSSNCYFITDGVCLHLLDELPIGTVEMLLGPPKFVTSPV